MEFRFQDYLRHPHRLAAMRRFMNRTPSWSPERMAQWQLLRLRDLLDHAAAAIPHYRHALKGLHSDDIRHLDDWSKLPRLTKGDIRAHLADLQAAGSPTHTMWAQTSGSTGTALRILLDHRVNIAAFCVLWRHWDQCPGWWFGRRQLVVAGLSGTPVSYQRKPRILAVAASQLRADVLPAILRGVRRRKPVMLRGYPSALDELARLVEEAGEQLTFRGVVTHSETLQPDQRIRIERVFSGTVFDHYTHWERAASIGQCAAGSYHAHADYGYHEILREDGSPAAAGETGQLVVTGLHNRTMPLIRYETQDLAAWSHSACSCGSNFPVIERIDGRMDDAVYTPDGRRVGRLSPAIARAPHVRAAQVIQEERHAITVRIVTDPGFDAAEEDLLVAALRGHLGEEMAITVEQHAELPVGPGGKRRLVLSKIGMDRRSGEA